MYTPLADVRPDSDLPDYLNRGCLRLMCSLFDSSDFYFCILTFLEIFLPYS